MISSSINLEVLDAIYKRRIAGVPLKVGIQRAGNEAFETIEVEPADENGTLEIPAAFPAKVKIEFAGGERFGPATLEVQLSDAIDKVAEIMLPVKEPRFKEPVITNIQVGTLALTDGITLNKPQDVVVDKVGNVYFTEGSGHRILRVDRQGNTHVLAGTGTSGYEDGPGSSAKLNAPWGITIDDEGNLYFSDNSTSSSRIRKIEIGEDYKAVVSTIAGTGSTGGSDGVGTEASFNRPSGICFDSRTNSLYIAEWSGHRVRKIDLATRRVSTVAGAGSSGVVEGFGTDAKFQFPFGVALSPDGKFLYVASWNGNALHKIDLSNQYSQVLLRGNNLGSPRGIYVSPAGRLFLGSTGGHQVTYTEDPITVQPIPTLVGNGRGDTDGPAGIAQFSGPVGITYDPYTGTWYVADGDGNNQKIRTIRSGDLP